MVVFLFIILATTTADLSCYKFKNRDSKNEQQVNDAPDICDLIRRPENYDSKIVRVRSVLMGFHELAFYSRCEGQISYIRADIDSKSRNKLVKGVSGLDGRGMERGNFWVEVVANGRFEKISDSDCKNLSRESGLPNRYYPNYCYRIAIENVERVDPVPSTVEWPQ